jgi:hypothetical protein
MGLIKQLMEKLEEEEFIEAATLARLLWLRRNTYVFDGVFTAPTQLVLQAKGQVEGYAQANQRVDSIWRWC